MGSISLDSSHRIRELDHLKTIIKPDSRTMVASVSYGKKSDNEYVISTIFYTLTAKKTLTIRFDNPASSLKASYILVENPYRNQDLSITREGNFSDVRWLATDRLLLFKFKFGSHFYLAKTVMSEK